MVPVIRAQKQKVFRKTWNCVHLPKVLILSSCLARTVLVSSLEMNNNSCLQLTGTHDVDHLPGLKSVETHRNSVATKHD